MDTSTTTISKVFIMESSTRMLSLVRRLNGRFFKSSFRLLNNTITIGAITHLTTSWLEKNSTNTITILVAVSITISTLKRWSLVLGTLTNKKNWSHTALKLMGCLKNSWNKLRSKALTRSRSLHSVVDNNKHTDPKLAKLPLRRCSNPNLQIYSHRRILPPKSLLKVATVSNNKARSVSLKDPTLNKECKHLVKSEWAMTN